MAFTIRKLSIKSEDTLELIQDRVRWVNSKSKAVDFVLERHYEMVSQIERLQSRSIELEKDLEAEYLENLKIKQALKILSEIDFTEVR